MNTTPTTGTASELLLCPFCGKAPEGTHAYGILAAVCKTVSCPMHERYIYVEKWNTRTPAPVTEGAQREAVAWRIRYKGASYWSLVPDLSDLSEPLSSFETEPLYTAPPPPDRVQQREQETIDALAASQDAAATFSDSYAALVKRIWNLAKEWRMEAAAMRSPDGKTILVQCAEELDNARANSPDRVQPERDIDYVGLGPNVPIAVQPERVEADSFTHKRNAICERELGIPFEDPAPPTDASGGVTGGISRDDILRIRKLAEAIEPNAKWGTHNAILSGIHDLDCATPPKVIIALCNAALEAADRARPVASGLVMDGTEVTVLKLREMCSNGYYWYREDDYRCWEIVRIDLVNGLTVAERCGDGGSAQVSEHDMPGEFVGPIQQPLEAADRARKPEYRQVTLEDAGRLVQMIELGNGIAKGNRDPKSILAVAYAALKTLGAVIHDAGRT